MSTSAARWLAFLALAVGLAACSVSSDVSRELGARCDSHDECAELCLGAPEFPGGYCTVSCTERNDCPGGAACVDIDQGVCLQECEETSDCAFLGSGWVCAEQAALPDGVVKVCVGE